VYKWNHPVALHPMVIMCSVAAAVEGMGVPVINGGQLDRCGLCRVIYYKVKVGISSQEVFFFKQFGIQENEWLKGVNSHIHSTNGLAVAG
jgi:hypothetical protein